MTSCFRGSSVFAVRGFAEWKRERVEVKDDDEEDDQEVFTVELHRGPQGLGLALVDGMVSPLQLLLMLMDEELHLLAHPQKTQLKMSGVYVKAVVPGSPAARCQKLRTGDRILAVNGVSLVGLEYHV